jgi:hypothetical protein
MNLKAQCQVIHAKRRALERYGLSLNRKSYGELVKIIQSGKALFLERQSNRISIFSLTYQEKQLKCVYDSHRHKIVTLLPNETN